jgi:hypothetical protein
LVACNNQAAYYDEIIYNTEDVCDGLSLEFSYYQTQKDCQFCVERLYLFSDYSHYIGVWIGYAIAIFEFVEIIAAEGSYITFQYGGLTLTLPVADDKITFAYGWTTASGDEVTTEVILAFLDGEILLTRSITWHDNYVSILEWRLTPEAFWADYLDYIREFY